MSGELWERCRPAASVVGDHLPPPPSAARPKPALLGSGHRHTERGWGVESLVISVQNCLANSVGETAAQIPPPGLLGGHLHEPHGAWMDLPLHIDSDHRTLRDP